MALSDKLNILFPRDVDESSIDVTPAAETTLPESNIFDDRVDRFMRVLGTSAVIKLNTNGSELISGWAFPHNLKDGSTVRLRLYADDDQAGALQYDSTVLALDIDSSLDNFLPQIFYRSFDEVACQSIQIDISAPSNTFIDIGQLTLGFVFEPNTTFSLGNDWKWVDDGTARTAGNHYRQFIFDLNYLDDAENDIYENEKIKVSIQRNFVVCLRPSLTGTRLLKSTAICKRVNDITRSRNSDVNNTHKEIFQENY